MFEKLSAAWQKAFRNLRGQGRVTEANIADALREIRLALLEADVHYATAKAFVERVKARTLGQKVLQGVNPAQQFTKAVYDELVALLGGQTRDFSLAPPPARILMIGLHGSGKTTTTAKLARAWRQNGKKVLLAACDIRRPAAVEQLAALAAQVGVDVLRPLPGETVPDIGRRALRTARETLADIVIFDTGGRFQMDEPLVEELQALKAAVEPKNVVLVVDAAIGQESVSVARAFHEALGLTGLILTKLDGDARGGAALSIASEVGCPILRIGTGERPEDLEPFHPDRMASRILGMGDVVTLVEKVQQNFDAAQLAEFEEKTRGRKGGLTLEDFLSQMRQMKKIGSITKLVDLIPGLPSIPQEAREKMERESGIQMKKNEALIQSMTPRERRHPEILDASRRRRIARGAGLPVSELNTLLRGFRQAKEMAAAMQKRRRR
jgi:signal recognition particle subunit SRP54